MLEKIKKNYISIIFLFLITYFIFNLLGGERGLISYSVKKEVLEKLKTDEKNLINKISDIEHKNSLLSSNLDLDFIEILIRDKFLYGKKSETTYMINHNDIATSGKN